MYAITSAKGFTLFEALIYIALFTLIIGGSIASAYQIFEGTAQVQNIAERENEINFIQRKLDWVLNGASQVTEPTDDTLRVLKDGSVYEFTVNSGAVTMTIGGTDTYELSNSWMDISDINFSLKGTNPKILEISMVVDEENIGTTTKFLR
jgi:hypothetical protein